IWLGFACTALMVAAIWVGAEIAAALLWQWQNAYEEALGQTPRILLASFVAYLAGEFSNSFVLAKMKILTQGRWLWTRTVGSTLVGQAFDTVIFVTLAFAGTVPARALGAIIVAQWAVKLAYEAAAKPLTYETVSYLKASEHVDAYDYETDFNPIRL